MIRNQVVKMKNKQGEFNYQHVHLHIHEVNMQFPGFVNGNTTLSITIEIVQHNFYLFIPCLTQNTTLKCLCEIWYEISL